MLLPLESQRRKINEPSSTNPTLSKARVSCDREARYWLHDLVCWMKLNEGNNTQDLTTPPARVGAKNRSAWLSHMYLNPRKYAVRCAPATHQDAFHGQGQPEIYVGQRQIRDLAKEERRGILTMYVHLISDKNSSKNKSEILFCRLGKYSRPLLGADDTTVHSTLRKRIMCIL